jgi:hypothetical protein
MYNLRMSIHVAGTFGLYLLHLVDISTGSVMEHLMSVWALFYETIWKRQVV